MLNERNLLECESWPTVVVTSRASTGFDCVHRVAAEYKKDTGAVGECMPLSTVYRDTSTAQGAHVRIW